VGIAVARTRHRHVHGEHQRPRTQLPGAAHHVTHEATVLQHVQLEPDRVRGLRRHLCQRTHRDGRLDERNVAAAGGAHRLHFAAPRIHAGQADRRQRDRQRIVFAKPLHAQVLRFGAAQHALAQANRLQVVDVAAQGLLGAGAAVEIVEQERWQAPARCLAKIGGGRNDHGRCAKRQRERIEPAVYAGPAAPVHCRARIISAVSVRAVLTAQGKRSSA